MQPSRGEIYYNGRNISALAQDNIDHRRIAAYCDQMDTHESRFTVRETFEFAARASIGSSAAAADAPGS